MLDESSVVVPSGERRCRQAVRGNGGTSETPPRGGHLGVRVCLCMSVYVCMGMRGWLVCVSVSVYLCTAAQGWEAENQVPR